MIVCHFCKGQITDGTGVVCKISEGDLEQRRPLNERRDIHVGTGTIGQFAPAHDECAAKAGAKVIKQG